MNKRLCGSLFKASQQKQEKTIIITDAKSNYKKKIQDLISHVCLQRYLKIESAYWVVVGILLLCGIFKRICNPQVPFTGPDSIGYLGVAVRQIMTGEFHCIAERPWPYPGFLTILLNTCPNYKTISVFQHAMGSLAGLLFGFVWAETEVFFKITNHLQKGIFYALGLLGVYSLSCGEYFIWIENWSHPESISAIIQMTLIWCFIKFLNAGNSPLRVLFSITLISFLSFMTIFQPRTKLAFISGVALVAYINYREKLSYRLISVIIAASTLIIFLTQYYPFNHFCSSYQIRHTQAMTLFAGNMGAISKVLAADIQDPNLKAKKSVYCALEQFEMAKDKTKSKGVGFGWYESMAYNCDIFLCPEFYNKIMNYEGSTENAAKFYLSYVARSLLFEPGEYLKKIINGLFIAYFTQDILVSCGPPQKSWKYTSETLSAWPLELNGTFLKDYILAVDSPKSCAYPSIGGTPALNNLINKLYKGIPLLALCGVLFSRIFRISNKQDLVIAFLFLINLSVFLTVAFGLSTEVARYISDQAALSIFYICFGGFYLFQKTLQLISVKQ
jgi:hypothetical protein